MSIGSGQFIRQLKSSVVHARIRRKWARERLADAERQVRTAERDLKRWTRPERKRKRAKK